MMRDSDIDDASDGRCWMIDDWWLMIDDWWVTVMMMMMMTTIDQDGADDW